MKFLKRIFNYMDYKLFIWNMNKRTKKEYRNFMEERSKKNYEKYMNWQLGMLERQK